MGESYLQLTNGKATMEYCPWCGGAFPGSKRGSFFADPSDDDVAELEAVITSIVTTRDMHNLLGRPDDTIPSRVIYKPALPRMGEWDCQYAYSTKWDTVELTILEIDDGTLTFSYGGRCIGCA